MMKSYKNPNFQDRVGQAAEAKQKALDQLKSKPPADEAAIAERRAARAAKDVAEAQRREAKKAAEAQAKAAKAEQREAAKKSSAVSLPTEADLKAARDARYAARKSRK